MKATMTLLIVVLMLAVTASPLPVAAHPPTHVTGGGTGSFGADLDGDGDIDGSQFGIGVNILGNGAARGHFECLMAGRSDFLGLHLMSVGGQVTAGAVNPNGSVTFNGSGSVNLGNGQIFGDVPFNVVVTAGSAGAGTLTLTVIGAFDGVPGDQIIGNGNYDLPAEMVTSGQIAVH